jgi:cullin-associated NEDD8-dissociated protein 1
VFDLQGAALAELQALFPALAGTGSPAAKTEALLSALLDEGRGRRDGGGSTDGSARQAQHSVAQCCAVLVVPAGQTQVDATVKQLLQMLKSADQGGLLGAAGFAGKGFHMQAQGCEMNALNLV